MHDELHPFTCASQRHNPHERAVLMEHSGWLVLLHPRNSPDYVERTAAGRLALQLWNRQADLSVLSPSVETNFAYEIFPVNDEVVRIDGYQGVIEFLREQGMAALPSDLLTELHVCFVLTSLIGATGLRAES